MKHFHEGIEGWCNFEELIRLLVATLPRRDAVWIEVGTWKGRSAAFTGVEMIRQGKKGVLHCVDTWKGSDEQAHKADPDIQAGTLLEHCQLNLKPLGDLVRYTVAESVKAAECFPDRMADVVFLDAAHDKLNVLADLKAWGPKVGPGGYLAGDDLSWQGVADAVGEFFVGNQEWALSVTAGPENYPVWFARKKGPEGPLDWSAWG